MISPEPLSDTATLLAGQSTDYERLLADGPQDPRVNRQFRRLADNIIKELPANEGGTLLFTGVGSSCHIADVAGYVARQLSLQPDVTVTLVDADPDLRTLSQRFDATDDDGLAEVLQEKLPVAAAVVPTVVKNIRFLPFGTRLGARQPATSQQVKSLLANLRSLSRYVVVATGTEQHLLRALISRHSDGTYLVVQLGMADRQRTTELAGHLTASGARLLGCVATGVD